MTEKPDKMHRTLTRLKMPSWRRSSSDPVHEEGSEGDESTNSETSKVRKVSQSDERDCIS